MGNGVGNFVFSEGVAKQSCIFRGNWLGAPLVVVFGKELNAVAAAFVGGVDGFVIAARNGHVRSKNRHDLPIPPSHFSRSAAKTATSPPKDGRPCPSLS